MAPQDAKVERACKPWFQLKQNPWIMVESSLDRSCSWDKYHVLWTVIPMVRNNSPRQSETHIQMVFLSVTDKLNLVGGTVALIFEKSEWISVACNGHVTTWKLRLECPQLDKASELASLLALDEHSERYGYRNNRPIQHIWWNKGEWKNRVEIGITDI
jgi:hypothetical protein